MIKKFPTGKGSLFLCAVWPTCTVSPISSLYALLLLQLDHHQLMQHNYNQNITSSHHHPLFSSSHAMISTPPPSPPQITTFHASFLCVSRSVPSPLIINNSTFQKKNQPAMIRSLSCKVLFLDMSSSVPTCKVLFLVVQGSVPSCHDPFLCMSSSGPYR